MIQLLAQSPIAASNGTSGGSTLGLIVPLALMGFVFYFLLIRPQRTRQRQQQTLLSALAVGDEVMTASGIFGTLTGIDDDTDTVTVEVAPGTELRMLRRAIAQRLTEPEEAGEDYDDEEDPVEDDGSDQEAGERS